MSKIAVPAPILALCTLTSFFGAGCNSFRTGENPTSTSSHVLSKPSGTVLSYDLPNKPLQITVPTELYMSSNGTSRGEKDFLHRVAMDLTRDCPSWEDRANRLLGFIRKNVKVDDDVLSTRTSVSVLYQKTGTDRESAELFRELCASIKISTILVEVDDHILAAVAGRFNGASIKNRGIRYYYADTSFEADDPHKQGGVGWLSRDYHGYLPRVLKDEHPFTLRFKCSEHTHEIVLSPTALSKYEQSEIARRVGEVLDEEILKEFLSYKDPSLAEITRLLTHDLKRSRQKIARIREFIDRYAPYSSDPEDKYDQKGDGEYWKYPLETITDRGGDCEDSAILLASMLKEAGFDVALIIFEDHVGVGIDGNFSGSCFKLGGKKYFYVESTNKDIPIGELESKYESARVYRLE